MLESRGEGGIYFLVFLNTRRGYALSIGMFLHKTLFPFGLNDDTYPPFHDGLLSCWRGVRKEGPSKREDSTGRSMRTWYTIGIPITDKRRATLCNDSVLVKSSHFSNIFVLYFALLHLLDDDDTDSRSVQSRHWEGAPRAIIRFQPSFGFENCMLPIVSVMVGDIHGRLQTF
jgi:hypothetical protein